MSHFVMLYTPLLKYVRLEIGPTYYESICFLTSFCEPSLTTLLHNRMRDRSYEERLKECGLTTIETRRLRINEIDVIKVLNGYENNDRNMFHSSKRKLN